MAPGTLAVVAVKGRVSRICFKRSPAEAAREVAKCYPDAIRGSSSLIRQTLQQCEEYFLGKRKQFKVPLDDASLTPFTRRVHQALSRIPYGSVVSYGQLAALAGHPGAARAVGRAMSSNPFPLIIPCHRVIVSNGSLGLYTAADGASTKAWLLDFERRHAVP